MKFTIAAIAATTLATVVTASAGAAWTTNLVQLDNGTCGHNLQIGNDRTASSSATPTFWLQGDGGLSTYEARVDDAVVGVFSSDGRANVCIAAPGLFDGRHLLTIDELAPHARPVDPFVFTVDTVPPPHPTVPILSAYSDSGRKGDAITTYKSVNFTGRAEPGITVFLRSGLSVIGGARTGMDGKWSATTGTFKPGVYSIFAVAADSAGNIGAASPARKLIIR